MADDSVPVPGPEAASGLLNQWFPGGIAGAAAHLAIGKTASQAIARLIGALTDIPVAGFESVTQRIRSNTEGRKIVRKALATAAARRAAKDDALVDRAVLRLAGKHLRAQENVEAVALRAVENLRVDPPNEGQERGPSDDFMNAFESFAENASSESLRDLFGRILAGEIRKPETFSLRTLQLVSVLDQKLAADMQTTRNWLVKDMIVRTDALNRGENLDAITNVMDFGLIKASDLTFEFTLSPEGKLLLPYRPWHMVVSGKPGGKFQISVWPLTRVGMELMGVVTPAYSFGYIKDVGSMFKATNRSTLLGPISQPTISKVEILELADPDASGIRAILSRTEV